MRVTPHDLVTFRRALGFNTEQFAEVIRVQERTLRRWERGQGHIPEGLRNDLVDIFALFILDVRDIRAGREIYGAPPWEPVARFWAANGWILDGGK